MTYASKEVKEAKNAKTVGTKLTSMEYGEIMDLIEAGVFLSVSDFIRDAIRDKLRATKIIKIRNVDYESAKKEVLGYYRNYAEAYDYEVAEDLELDYELVCTITEELEKEGRLKTVK
ncbi:MAG TPA: ribbon-helix-helix domain-containing protein [Methanobacterium sp.]|nr:ribbon-helix-helix domain-containing protein [Methanobacterium sp.]